MLRYEPVDRTKEKARIEKVLILGDIEINRCIRSARRGRRMGEAMQGVCQRKGDRWDILWFGIQMVG